MEETTSPFKPQCAPVVEASGGLRRAAPLAIVLVMSWLAKLFGGAAKVMPTTVDDASFEREVLRSELPVLIDAWSPGCAPCKQLEPVLVSLATTYEGRVKVCEFNTAASPRVAMGLAIRGTPTVVYVEGGKEKERVVGFRGSLYHEQTIEEVFGIPKKPADPEAE